MQQADCFIRRFDAIGLGDVALVGGKNASLGEMVQQLTQAGIRVPDGFAITAAAYRHHLTASGLWQPLQDLMTDLDGNDLKALQSKAHAARSLIYAAPLPLDVQQAISDAFARLQRDAVGPISVAVRSSATAEDLPTASFAGQQDSYLNISSLPGLLDACKRCFASLFTDRAIHYRLDQGFDQMRCALSIGVMTMVRSDLAASGVMFSLDTESGFDGVVFITAAYGLGETVVQGAVDPDEFYVHKPTLALGYRQVLRRRLGSKKIQMVYSNGSTRAATCTLATSQQQRQQFCISDSQVLALADAAVVIERHYGRPMDMEWALDGIDGQLYIVQARPETIASQQPHGWLEQYQLVETGRCLAQGHAVGHKISSGVAHRIASAAELHLFTPGGVLVTDMTTPDWEPMMKTAAAIVTNRGGRTCHAAIVARELGVPAVIGCNDATETIDSGEVITVSCAEGEVGKVYAGALPIQLTRTDLSGLAQPKTHMMLNVGNPDSAFSLRFLPSSGVGLARMDFIITDSIKAHPMALLYPDQVVDAGERQQLQQLTHGYDRAADFFIERLAEGIATIAAAFYPKPVVVRLSDFKTNEYASLLGGSGFEPVEANPMIGFRGAARYIHPRYAEGFALECAAIKRVREQMGLLNVIVMIPFCRTVAQTAQVVAQLATNGLERGQYGLLIYMMCEIPNNVLQLEAFAEHVDGFSIGSNDLTQLTLGVDRDSALVADCFDERDAGVLRLLEMTVKEARRLGKHCGICGQAPSDYPELAELLVQWGIDAISLNPDSVLETSQRIVALEQQLGR